MSSFKGLNEKSDILIFKFILIYSQNTFNSSTDIFLSMHVYQIIIVICLSLHVFAKHVSSLIQCNKEKMNSNKNTNMVAFFWFT